MAPSGTQVFLQQKGRSAAALCPRWRGAKCEPDRVGGFEESFGKGIVSLLCYNYVILCYLMLCYCVCYISYCIVIYCYVELCYVMFQYVVLCPVMLCYVAMIIARYGGHCWWTKLVYSLRLKSQNKSHGTSWLSLLISKLHGTVPINIYNLKSLKQ